MKQRIITALLIILCVIPPLVYGGWLMGILIAFIIIMGGNEWLSLKHDDTKWPLLIKPLCYMSVIGLLFVDLKYIPTSLSVLCLIFLSIPVFTTKFEIKDSFLCISYFIFFYSLANSVIQIYTKEPLFMWYIIIATYATDTGAYFSGRFFGKHKLNERISPKKTIEGSIGGWLFGMLFSLTFAYFMFPQFNFIIFIIASSLLCIVGQIGDLAFSAIKRNFNIKDFSDLLPGHGGVLDRVDSLLFNFVCFYMVLAVLL